MAVYGVLLPLPFDDVFDYTAEEELVPGQLVEVPFGREELVGVVWKKGQSANIDPKKIKQIKSVVQLPRQTAEMTAFIRKTAEYNLAPLGMVLKMVLGMKSNQLPKQKVTLYGLKIKNENLDGIRITEARKAVFDFLDGGLEAEKEEIISGLKALSELLFRKGNVMISYTASREGLAVLEEEIGSLKEALYPERTPESRCILHCEKKNEGFKTSSKVHYAAKAGNFIDAAQQYNRALQILKVIMSYEYLWINIRVKGGAYGCMSNFNRIGEGYFVSYRDPNLGRTLEIYDGVPEYLENFTVSERDMTKYIIGTISNIDQPMTPATKGDRSMNLYMNHVSAEMIRKEREQILTANQEDIRALAGVARAVLANDQICVIGNEAKIEEEKELFMTVENLF